MMLRIVVLPLFLVLLALSGGCQHPCQANPEQCPSLRLEVKGEPPVEAYPGLIQRRAPNPVVDITVSTSDQSKFGEVTAYLFRLRHANDPEYQATVQRRMDDKDAAHWLTLNEVEKRLDQN